MTFWRCFIFLPREHLSHYTVLWEDTSVFQVLVCTSFLAPRNPDTNPAFWCLCLPLLWPYCAESRATPCESSICHYVHTRVTSGYLGAQADPTVGSSLPQPEFTLAFSGLTGPVPVPSPNGRGHTSELSW